MGLFEGNEVGVSVTARLVGCLVGSLVMGLFEGKDVGISALFAGSWEGFSVELDGI
jgi:hypothetical protein